jgi:hypothetical protein
MKQLSITNVVEFDLRELSQALSEQLLNDNLPPRMEMLTLEAAFELIHAIGSKQSLAAELCVTVDAELGYWRLEKQKLKVNDTPFSKEEIERKITSENARADMVNRAFSALDKKYNSAAKMIRLMEQAR